MANANPSASVQSPEDIVNNALRRIGYKFRVNNIYDGTTASKLVLDIYAQTRDSSLREFPWTFAEKIIAASLSGTAPNIWAYSYAYPNDCLVIRGVYGPAYLSDRNDPLPVNYTSGQDASLGRVIWTNMASATLVYTMRVTDMSQWDALFVEAVCGAIGRRLSGALADKELLKMAAEDEQGEFANAASMTE